MGISGAVVWSTTYEAFGKAAIDPASTIVNNLTFPGQYFDQETGLRYNWHRFYDPVIGRYSAKDPIGLYGGINLYSYAASSPLGYLDPRGLWFRDVHYEMTKRIATDLGFVDCAAEIAANDQMVDEDDRSPLPGIDPYSDKAIENRRRWHFTLGERRSQLYHQAMRSCTPYDIGSALHTIQDSFSHEGFTPEEGHPRKPLADSVSWNKHAAERTRQTTESFLRDIYQTCKNKMGRCCKQ